MVWLREPVFLLTLSADRYCRSKNEFSSTLTAFYKVIMPMMA